MTLLVRDEADIVDANIRYHLAQGVTFVIATDNRSVDGTARILRDHERAGHLRYLYEPQSTFAQSEWVTRMARLAATEHAADWVINNDADEFWWPHSGDLRSTLASIPSDVGILEAPRSNFAPRPEHIGPWANRMVVRELASRNALGRPLPGKVCHRAHAAVVVAPGNHAAIVPGAERWQGQSPIQILHYPMRSRGQMMRKVGHAREALKQGQAQGVGETWVHMVEMQHRGTFPAWYAQQELDDLAVDSGIEDGRLVEDRRLQRYLASRGIMVQARREEAVHIRGKLATSLRRISSRPARR